MKSSRLFASVLIAASATVVLAACDTPMPPEVRAVVDEMQYTCVKGSAAVLAPENMQDITLGWTDSMTYSCVDPEPVMGVSFTTDAAATVDGEISPYAAKCEPLQTIPVALDAGVLVYNQPDLGGLNVSPEHIAGILTGKITNWSELASDNPGYDISPLPITVFPEADTASVDSLLSYLKIANAPVDGELLVKSVNSPNAEQYTALEYGQFAVVPYSYATYFSLYAANIFLGIDSETEEPKVAVPNLDGIQSAASQLAITKSSTLLSVKLDSSKEPVVASGFNPEVPYQAIFPVNYYTCNEATLVPRAVGRFLLRLDQQGGMGNYNYSPLPEPVRVEAAFLIRQGLPTPTPSPAE
jgi:ABC-type phosphate transport system substrate-binding protein